MTLEPQHRVLGVWERWDLWQGLSILVSLVGRRNCLRPDGGLQTRVLRPLFWELDRGNQSVVTALGGVVKQPRHKGHQGEQVSKSATCSLSPAQPLVSEPARQDLRNLYPHRCSNCRCMTRDWGGELGLHLKWVIVVTPVAENKLAIAWNSIVVL
jgi:hypothetical protein